METNEKLVWLGIKTNAASQSVIQGEIQHLKETIGDWSTFQTEVGNDTTYEEFKTTLTDAGWTEEEAQTLIDKIKNAYTDDDSSGTTWDEFSDDVANNHSSYEEWSTVFDSGTGVQGDGKTDSGEPIAGVRIHENAGISYSGVEVPGGTIEVFGQRVEFSQQDPPRGSEAKVAYSNFSTDDADNTETIGNDMVFSADVTNANSWAVTATVPLTEDGEVVDSKEVRIPASGTETVSFSVTKNEYVCAEYAIGDTSTILACWTPAGIQVT